MAADTRYEQVGKMEETTIIMMMQYNFNEQNDENCAYMLLFDVLRMQYIHGTNAT
jgi:hypothetical protein